MCTRAVGAFAHYLEEEGLATTQISLVRPHTEQIRPPRALWVPFELGRPLGVPNDAAFQTRVLMACLTLLGADSGPVLEDYSEDVPAALQSTAEDMQGMVCEIDLAPPPTDVSDLVQALLDEIVRVRPWYDMALRENGRTTVGASQLAVEQAARFLAGFVETPTAPVPRDDIEVGALLKLVCEDLKAFYSESTTVQPGMDTSLAVEHWLWNETVLGRVMWTFREANTDNPDPYIQYLARRQVVPDRQVHYKGAAVFAPIITN